MLENTFSSQTKIKKFIDIANGKTPADLCIQNAKIINIFTNEIIIGKDLLIGNGKIIGIVKANSAKAIDYYDAKNNFLAPGFIDAHVHIESSMLSPENFANLVLQNGTTTIVADPHEIANVLGIKGIEYMIQSLENSSLNAYFMLPSCVPATPFENSGAILNSTELAKLINHPKVLGLGEMMNYPGVLFADDEVIAKLMLAYSHNKIVDGHAPMLSGQALDAYIGSGISTDHECTTIDEMKERIERGMYVLIRQGSSARDADTLLKGITKDNAHRCCFCCDDISPKEILEEGYMQRHLRLAIKNNVDPLTAIRMATINTATCYNLKNIGAIAPGYKADLVIVDNLTDFNVLDVFASGQKICKENINTSNNATSKDNTIVEKAINIAPITIEDFQLKASGKCKVIGVIPNSIVTSSLIEDIQADDKGNFDYNQNPNILKIAVIERHKASGNIGLGLIKGYIKENSKLNGAIASSVSHDSHNIVVIGDNDKDMHLAVQTIAKQGGGIVLIQNNEIKEMLPLPIAGLMSYNNPEEVKDIKIRLTNFPYANNTDPLILLSFLALSVIPELKITDQGLFDVRKFQFTPLQAD